MCDSELGGARELVDKLMAGHEAKRRSGNEKRRGKAAYKTNEASHRL
jgi:hypothetical protein